MKNFYVATTLLATVLIASLTVLAQTQSPEDQKRELETQRAEFKKKAATLVASDQERAKYADFLKAPNTGLIRLLPREKYIYQAYGEEKRVADPSSFARKETGNLAGNSVHASSRQGPPNQQGTTTLPALNTDVHTNLADLPQVDSTALENARKNNGRGGARDGGAYYSFTRQTHEYGSGSDLSLEQGQFQVGFAGANYGFLTNLGDVPLESVTLNTPETKQLVAYARAKKEPDARREHRRFAQGADINGVTVKNRVPMQLNSTYLLRAVNYGNSDVLVAFRVVEIDSDGTPLILWKLLKKYSTPQLALN